ncbi:MAG: hypothetical protein ABII00_10525 [Elusimicrobiota bacterium]
MPLSPGYRLEIQRKAFHCLSLMYLLAYLLLGLRVTLWAVGAWALLEGSLEVLRLRRPAFNARLMRFFRGIHRADEDRRVSGVFWTTLGCWFTMLAFGSRPTVVAAAILYLAFGDGAAALVGRAIGRVQIGLFGRRKSLEGSLACLAVCLAAGWAVGIRGPGLWAGAVVATLVEYLPMPLDDNLWLPVLSAGVLTLLA